jgi:hypothetical protein
MDVGLRTEFEPRLCHLLSIRQWALHFLGEILIKLTEI